MPVHFLDAKNGQCRYPLWGADKSIGDVCGEPAEAGRSYCSACRGLAYQVGVPRAPYVPRDRDVRRPKVAEDVTPGDVEMVA